MKQFGSRLSTRRWISDLPCHNRRHLPQTLTKTPTLARSALPHRPAAETTQADWRWRDEGDREKGGGGRAARRAGGKRRRRRKGGQGRVREKGRRHNNRRGKLLTSRESKKTLTIEWRGAELMLSRELARRASPRLDGWVTRGFFTLGYIF